jgi:uncharacterized membrane protein YukC
MVQKTKTIRVSLVAWKAVKKALVDSEFDIGDLVEWILLNEDLDEYVKDLESKVEIEEDGTTTAKSEDDSEDEDEDESEDEEEEEEAE